MTVKAEPGTNCLQRASFPRCIDPVPASQ
jgi:hypothetical protein